MPPMRHNAALACAACRRRKTKCDGIQPVCGPCATRMRECDYSLSVDGRRTNRPHRKIEELERQVAMLEEKLKQSPRSTPSRDPVSSSTAPSGPLSASAASTSAAAVVSASVVNDLGWHRNSAPPDLGPALGPFDTVGLSMGEGVVFQPTHPLPHGAFDVLHISTTGDVTYRGPTSVPPRPSDLPGMFTDYSWLNPFRGLESMIQSFSLAVDAHEELLKLYFQFLNGWSGFVDEAAFRLGMLVDATTDMGADPASGYSPFLHLAILSVSSHLCPNRERYGSTFLQAAYSLLASELQRPRPTTIIGLTLLTIEATEAAHNSCAWILSGVTTRVALALGLHVDTAPMVHQGAMTEAARRQRDDAFWSIYMDEKMVALFLGRPSALGSSDHDLSLPTESVPLVHSRGNDPGLQLALVSLCDICADVMRLFYHIRKDQRNAVREAQDLRRRLRTWRAKFDPRPLETPASSPAIAALTLHNAVLILLNRPFLHRRLLDSDEGTESWRAALDTIELARMYDDQFMLRKAPVTMSQTLYLAAAFIVLVLADLHDEPDRAGERVQAQAALDRLVMYLGKLAETWRAADMSLAALNAMQNEYAVRQAEPGPLDLSLDELLNLFLQPTEAGLWGGGVPSLYHSVLYGA